MDCVCEFAGGPGADCVGGVRHCSDGGGEFAGGGDVGDVAGAPGAAALVERSGVVGECGGGGDGGWIDGGVGLAVWWFRPVVVVCGQGIVWRI